MLSEPRHVAGLVGVLESDGHMRELGFFISFKHFDVVVHSVDQLLLLVV